MNILVYGGSGSGKSAWAEDLCLRLGTRLLYLATMPPHGEEAKQRITRHQTLRSGKGFETMEFYDDLRDLTISSGFDCVLLECAGNLVTNALFGLGAPAEEVADALEKGIFHLADQTNHLVVVTNDVFSDGIAYEGSTLDFVRCLSGLNKKLAQRFNAMIEVVFGIPISHKGGIL